MFLEYNECKTKHLFLIKKIAARFDEKIATWRKKSVDDPREESITADPEEDYHWGLKEDPIVEDTKENHCDTYRQHYQWKSKGAPGTSMTFAPQINPFWLFGNGMW